MPKPRFDAVHDAAIEEVLAPENGALVDDLPARFEMEPASEDPPGQARARLNPPPRTQTVRVWRAMLEVHADLIAELSELFRSLHGLSISEFDVLINMSPGEECRHGDLTGRVVLTRTALTRLIDRLVARGLLARSPDPSDQRGVLVHLTEAGRDLRRVAARHNAAAVHRYFSVLDDDQLRALGSAVAALQQRHSTAQTHSAPIPSAPIPSASPQ